MYYGSGTAVGIASSQAVYAAGAEKHCMCTHQTIALFSVK